MAVYKIFPEKDATIYSGFPLKNTGIDQILEISTFYNTTNPEVSRALIKFSQNEIEQVFEDVIVLQDSTDYQVNLKLYIADINGLNSDTTLEVFAVSESYNMGTGKYSNTPETTNGVGWTFRNSSGSNAWKNSSWVDNATGSFSGSNEGGGTWYTGSNLGLDITPISTPRLAASLGNNPNTFRSGSISKIRVNSRPQFPTRVFQTASLYTTNHYLPTHSFYAVKDLDTNEFVIDFDNSYTKLSQDESGSFFKLYMSGLQPERYYQILLKTHIEDEVIILDDNYYFKVING